MQTVAVVLDVSSCTPLNAAAWPVPVKESFAADRLLLDALLIRLCYSPLHQTFVSCMLQLSLWHVGLMNAVMAVEWPITFEFSEDSRYNTLLQISVGQEEVDEVIGRDINRTFPEHPQFGFEQGQQALYRVLKAYSLHDLEVGYCQVCHKQAVPLSSFLQECFVWVHVCVNSSMSNDDRSCIS